jgi:hypothetical protein
VEWWFDAPLRLALVEDRAKDEWVVKQHGLVRNQANTGWRGPQPPDVANLFEICALRWRAGEFLETSGCNVFS